MIFFVMVQTLVCIIYGDSMQVGSNDVSDNNSFAYSITFDTCVDNIIWSIEDRRYDKL